MTIASRPEGIDRWSEFKATTKEKRRQTSVSPVSVLERLPNAAGTAFLVAPCSSFDSNFAVGILWEAA